TRARCGSERTRATSGTERKSVLLRLAPAVHDALGRCAPTNCAAPNAQIEFLLRRALAEASRMPSKADAQARPAATRARSRLTRQIGRASCRERAQSRR